MSTLPMISKRVPYSPVGTTLDGPGGSAKASNACREFSTITIRCLLRRKRFDPTLLAGHLYLLSQAQNLATRIKNGAFTPDQALAILSSLRLDFAQQIPRGAVSADPKPESDESGPKKPLV